MSGRIGLAIFVLLSVAAIVWVWNSGFYETNAYATADGENIMPVIDDPDFVNSVAESLGAGTDAGSIRRRIAAAPHGPRKTVLRFFGETAEDAQRLGQTVVDMANERIGPDAAEQRKLLAELAENDGFFVQWRQAALRELDRFDVIAAQADEDGVFSSEEVTLSQYHMHYAVRLLTGLRSMGAKATELRRKLAANDVDRLRLIPGPPVYRRPSFLPVLVLWVLGAVSIAVLWARKRGVGKESGPPVGSM